MIAKVTAGLFDCSLSPLSRISISWYKDKSSQCVASFLASHCHAARSQHMRPYPWQGREGENLTGKADQVLRGFEKASSRDPTHDKVTRRKPDRQGRSGFQGFRKAAPGAHLKDGICLSDACLNRLLPNFYDTGRRPSPISFQIRINLEH